MAAVEKYKYKWQRAFVRDRTREVRADNRTQQITTERNTSNIEHNRSNTPAVVCPSRALSRMVCAAFCVDTLGTGELAGSLTSCSDLIFVTGETKHVQRAFRHDIRSTMTGLYVTVS